jgi:hypothetical protein
VSYMFPDTVEIFQPSVASSLTKEKSFVSTGQVEAYVEDFDEILYNSLGSEIRPDLLVGLPKGVTVAKGWQIKVIKRKGVDVSAMEEAKEVKKLHFAGAFKVSHLEAYIG